MRPLAGGYSAVWARALLARARRARALVRATLEKSTMLTPNHPVTEAHSVAMLSPSTLLSAFCVPQFTDIAFHLAVRSPTPVKPVRTWAALSATGACVRGETETEGPELTCAPSPRQNRSPEFRGEIRTTPRSCVGAAPWRQLEGSRRLFRNRPPPMRRRPKARYGGGRAESSRTEGQQRRELGGRGARHERPGYTSRCGPRPWRCASPRWTRRSCWRWRRPWAATAAPRGPGVDARAAAAAPGLRRSRGARRRRRRLGARARARCVAHAHGASEERVPAGRDIQGLDPLPSAKC